MSSALRRSWRLLVSARDPGAAAHLAAIVAEANRCRDLDVSVIAAEETYPIFCDVGVKARKINSSVGEESLTSARSIVESVRPDAVLVGLSGPERGIDEAIIAVADSAIPTYALQDFWGDVNPGFGVLPRVYFVVDEDAVPPTAERAPQARIIVVGNVRYAAYGTAVDPVDMQFQSRRRLGATDMDIVIGFYGQGHIDIPGYWAMLASFGDAIANTYPRAIAFYRPHPKENEDIKNRSLSILRSRGANFRQDIFDSVEESVTSCHVLATWFSSCGTTQINLSRFSREPLGVVLYLNTNPELQSWYNRYNHIPTLPLADFAVVAERESDVVNALTNALAATMRWRLWRSIHDRLPNPNGSIDMVLDTIRSDLLHLDGTSKISS